jgi:UDP-GlcNAc:undecaprenyl-phosphate GlcNAc-1-phosphate transferase
MGLSQKQTVAVLYVISAILGLSAVVLTTNGIVKAMLFLMALCVAGGIAGMLYLGHQDRDTNNSEEKE